MIIKIQQYAGTFAENKDTASSLRDTRILPALKEGHEISLDFEGVTGATQSFVHALISEAVRQYGDNVFELLTFKDCSPTVQGVVNIVADYMQES
jgi:hypothetical protein